MRGPLSFFTQIVLILVIGGAAYGGWREKDLVRGWLGIAEAGESTPQQRRPRGDVPVIVAPVTAATDALRLEAVGTAIAVRSVTLRSEASGRVAASKIEAGRLHATGDVLMQLDDREQRLAARMALATLEDAERTRARLARLSQSGAAAAASLDEATTSVQIARIELERARDAIADRVIRAPFEGVTGLPRIEPGDWVETGEAVATYDDRRTLLVEFDLPEVLLSRVRGNLAVTATTPSAPGRSFAGRVTAIDSRVDSASRATRVRVAIPNEYDVLRPGASFTVTLALDGERYPVVPELALQFSRGSLYVWKLADSTVERVEVAMVRRRGGTVLVDGQLSAGDQVVVEGTQRLSEGRTVSVLDTDGPSP